MSNLFEFIIKGAKHFNFSGNLASECNNLVLPYIVIIFIYPNLKHKIAI